MDQEKRPAKTLNPIVANLVRSLLPSPASTSARPTASPPTASPPSPCSPGEERAAWLLYEHHGRAMLATVALTPDDRIARLVATEPAADFLARLIDQGGKG